MTDHQADESPESPHLNVKLLAARWHTTAGAIYIARHRGKAPKAFRRGRELLFPLVEVERYEAELAAADGPSNRMSGDVGRPPEIRSRRRRMAASPAENEPLAATG